MKKAPRKGAMMDGVVKHGNPPCYGCEERAVACHSKCDKYREYRANLDEKKAIVSEQLKKEYNVESYNVEVARKIKKRAGVK